ALVIQRARNFTMRRQARLIPLLLSLNPFGFVQNDIGLLVPSQPLDRFRPFVCRPGYAKSHLKIFYYLIHRSSPLRRLVSQRRYTPAPWRKRWWIDIEVHDQRPPRHRFWLQHGNDRAASRHEIWISHGRAVGDDCFLNKRTIRLQLGPVQWQAIGLRGRPHRAVIPAMPRAMPIQMACLILG